MHGATASKKPKPKFQRSGNTAQRASAPADTNSSLGGRSNNAQLGAFYSAGPAVGLATPVQAKFTIGKANDPFEREADSVADQVVRNRPVSAITPVPAGGLGSVARLESEEEPEDAMPQTQLIQRVEDQQPEGEMPQTKPIQRMAEEETAETPAQPKFVQPQLIQRMDQSEDSEESAQAKPIQRMAEEESEESAQTKPIQRMAEEGPEESAQAKPIQRMAEEESEESAQTKPIQRMAEEESEGSAQAKPIQRMAEEAPEESAQAKPIQRMAEEESEESAQTKPIQRMAEEESEETPVQPQHIQRMEAEESEGTSVQPRFIQRMETEKNVHDIGVQKKAEEPQEPEEPVQTRLIQRQEEAEEESAGQVQREEEQTEMVQTDRGTAKGASGFPSMAKAAAHAVQNSGPGGALNHPLRNTLESRMGFGLGDIRVHQDSAARESTRQLKARAFTNQNHIWLGRGESQNDLALMAHETTHVLQQTGSVQRKLIQRKAVAPEEAAEELPSEAEKAAALAAARAAEQVAAQAVSAGRNEVTKSKTDEAMEREASKAAKEEAAQAAGATRTEGAAAAEGEAAEEPGSVEEEKVEDKGAEAETPADAAKAAKGGAGKGAPGAAVIATGGLDDKAPASADEDPAFKAVLGKVKGVGAKQRAHAPAKSKADDAQSAAESPKSELDGKAQANQVGEMEEAEAPAFNAAAFKAQLMDRIKALAPKTVKEADNFKKDNKVGALKGDMQGKVAEEKAASQAPMAEKAAASPDTSAVEPKPVTPLAPADPGVAPASVGAERAVPKSKGRSELEAPLEESSGELDQKMAEADVDEEQLQKSNEPEFQGAVSAKTEAQTNAREAPQDYRGFERGQISQAEGDAAATAQERTQGMHAARGELLTQVEGRQGQTKSKDEQARDKIAGDIRQIYEKTKTNVEKILDDLDGKVAEVFDTGAEAAKQAFEDYVDAKMSAYKEERYGGWLGWARWGKDKLLGMPSEVNAFYRDGRQLYLDKMDAVIDNVVALIGTELTEAKAEIANGKKEIQDYVNQLPADLKTVGQQAAEEIQSKFDDLESSVDSKQNELIDTLANKYQENLQAIDARIEELKAANQGLVDKALNAVVGVIKTIIKLKNMLTTVLAKIADVVGKIIKDPIGFLGNLISGLVKGFENFVSNIWTHLQTGLIGWLTGALGPVGIQIPDDLFSLKGIFSLVSQILGLTWDYVRRKAVKLLGEPVVKALETAFTPFKILITEGPAGLWEFIKDQFNDLKEMVIGKIKDMVITEVIKAGVKWILGLLNPAAAFIKAAMAIYDIVMFFIERGSQILELVNSIVDAVAAIASGAIGGAAKLVENALAKALPVVIGFLASLLGIGGLAKKVQGIIKAIRKRIDKAIDKLLMKAKKLAKKPSRGKKEAGKITPADKKQHEKYIQKIRKELSEKPAKAPSSFEEFYGLKKKQALKLKSQYQQKLKKGIKLSVEFQPLAKDKKDNDMDLLVKIAPNTTKDQFNVEFSQGNLDKLVVLMELPNDKRTPEQRKSILDRARGLLNNNTVLDNIFKARESNILTPKALNNLLNKIIEKNWADGFAIRSFKEYGGLVMGYRGLYYNGNRPASGPVIKEGGNQLGFAEIEDGELKLNLKVPDSIKRLGIKGVGKKMFELGEAFYRDQVSGIRAEWLTLPIYKKTGGGKSDNLIKFTNEYNRSKDKIKAAKATWTYRRAAEKGYSEVTEVNIEWKDGIVGGEILNVDARLEKE